MIPVEEPSIVTLVGENEDALHSPSNKIECKGLMPTFLKRRAHTDNDTRDFGISFMAQDDVVVLIMGFCDHRTVANLIFVCRHFNHLVNLYMLPIFDRFISGEIFIEGQFGDARVQFRKAGTCEMLSEIVESHEERLEKCKEDFSASELKVLDEDLRRAAIGVDFADKNSMVDLILGHCDFDDYFEKQGEGEFERVKDLLLSREGEETRIGRFSIAEDDEDEFVIRGGDTEIFWFCSIPMCKWEAIELFTKIFSTEHNNEHENLLGSHLAWNLFSTADCSSIKWSMFKIQDSTICRSCCSVTRGISFVVETKNGQKVEIYGFFEAFYARFKDFDY